MDHALLALPIQPGQTEAARAFLHELEGPRKPQYAASEGRLGLVREVLAIQRLPQGDIFVVYFTGADIGRVLAQFVASRDEFDQWFKGRVLAMTGTDLSVIPPGPLSEILSVFEA